MELVNCPPQLLFVHEWWIELCDDLKLAGTLFDCAAGNLPAEIKCVATTKAAAALLSAHTSGSLPPTQHGIIYGIWFDPERDWQPVIGQIDKDEWLRLVRDGGKTRERPGTLEIIRMPRTDVDRAADPRIN
jgi:hypothetical protein